MISDDQVIIDLHTAETVSDRLTSVFLPVTAPRIHSPLNDLPTRGFELIDFADRFIGRLYAMAKMAGRTIFENQK
jgi:hypothetical protein